MSLFVGKIASTISTDSLKLLFEVYGTTNRIDHRGNHAFITFDKMESAEKAMKELKGKDIEGSK